MEKSFQELDSFELQVEPVKSPPNEDVEMKGGNNEDDKKDKEKSKNSGNKKGKKAKFTKKNTKLQVQEEDKPTHRRSIRHLSS